MTDFLQLSFAGLALGALYALVALGFVIIYKATGVINFAQGGLVLLGGYLTYNVHHTWGVPFYLSIPVAMILCGMVGAAVERVVLRRMVGQPVFAVIMVTIGLLFVIEQVVTGTWGFNRLNMGDPWGIKKFTVGDVQLSVVNLWTIMLAALVMAGFFLFFRYSRLGVAMRATAFDQEAAIANGISARRIFALSWAIAGAVATLAGVMLASGGSGLSPEIEFVALLAFPAIILGGLDSPAGAVLGGVIIGLTQTLTAGYQPRYADWLGNGFSSVMPYVVMIVILLIRPYGLFGTKEVRRV
ncbi:MAG: branched-chain amino acid transport system permease protein [Acidimicrobiaceae bacterium]|nr:branched-chain amino acid transport system permease protein [Acidimicrobiaceae bacterium]